MGQAMVRNALSQSGLSEREQEQVRAKARTKGVSAALGLLDSLKQAAQARLAALEARVTRMEERLDEAQQSSKSPTVPYPRRPLYPDPETADMTEAERLAEYKQSAAYQARQARYRQWEAQQAYLRYRQGEWADPKPMAQPAESRSLWQRAWDWTTDHAGKIVKSVKSTMKALRVRNLKFNRLEDGHISVRAETPPGTRLDYKNLVANEGFDFAGTRYNPETVAGITSKGIWEKMGKGALSKGSLVFAGVVSFGQNMLTFGKGKKFGSPEYWNATVKNRAFWVSTAVDFAVSVAVGVAAAAVVAGVIALTVAFAPAVIATAIAAAPLWAVVGTTALVGIGIGMGLEYFDIPRKAKNWLNNTLP